jgi:nucleoside phosphorylase
MHLITMAHLGEALGVIEKFNLKRITAELFSGEKLMLLLTGEGPMEAAIKTALLLPQHLFTEVINLGICGTLDEKFKVGEIHQVRSLYLVQDLKPSFKTFQASDKGLDCLTSFERILDGAKAQKLKGLGTLVDREAWGIAMTAKTHGIKFSSYKLISDVAGSLSACELVKENATLFSAALADFLSERLTKTETNKSEVFKLQGFYFTFSTEHKFKTLLTKLSIKENISEEEVKETLPLKELNERKLLPKERARLLMEEMQNRIDPTKMILTNKINNWSRDFEKNGIKVQTDPLWESPMVTLSLEVSTDQELKDKISKLNDLSLKPFTDLMNGDFHVE